MIARTDQLLALASAVVLAAAGAAFAWACDDAFISYRYAEQLVAGNGLVFNPGEPVEGYSNFLWTLWCALGIALQFDVEPFSHVLSIGAMVAAALLLWALHRGFRQRPAATDAAVATIPVACVALAFHRDVWVYATSGLETALYTALLTAAFVVLVRGPVTLRRAFGTGLLLGLAALTRPDAPLVAFLCGLYVLWQAEKPIAAGAAIFAGFALLWAPHLGFRYSFYGELVPNTAHAKSAGVAWWDQGLAYVGLFLRRYPLLALGPLLLVVRLVRFGREATTSRPDLVLAAAIGTVYTVYVARVGGDFMFARFLVPVVPVLLWSLEGELAALVPSRSLYRALAAAAIVAVVLAVPPPVSGTSIVDGVADEWDFYHARPAALGGKSPAELTADMGRKLRPYLDGVPASVLIIGSQARLAWHSKAHTVIEANGLTDRHIARQPIKRRGRPGHEKHPTFDYIVRQRGVHLAFSQAAMHMTRRRIPTLAVRFGGVQGLVLSWDNAIMAQLAERGATVPDYLAMLDATIARLPELDAAARKRLWAMHHDFYFRHNDDPIRRAAFGPDPS